MTMVLAGIFVLGLIVGSFLNVVIYRLPRDESVVKPGSRCVHCKKSIKPWNNIPLVSYALLKGKCAHCKKPISPRYPFVEFLTGLLFVTSAHKFGVNLLLFVHDLPFVSALIAVTFIDLDHRIIPDELSLGLVILGVITGGFVPGLVGYRRSQELLSGLDFFMGLLGSTKKCQADQGSVEGISSF